jgi:hypothetical protein
VIQASHAPAAPPRPARHPDAQQKDHLCGPFQGARLLLEAGVARWDGEPIDQDLIAARAGTVLPAVEDHPAVPPGARSLRNYRFQLEGGSPERAGTAPGALAAAIEAAASGALRCLPLRGRWSADRVERLVEAASDRRARLVANLRTGALWASRPPLEALLAALEEDEVADPPAADWDVGHYLELSRLIRGRRGSLVIVVDS